MEKEVIFYVKVQGHKKVGYLQDFLEDNEIEFYAHEKEAEAVTV